MHNEFPGASRPAAGLIIAVDGPAAAGKGTLARSLAAALGLPFLDTGLLYRAVGRRMLDAGLDPASGSGADAEAQARGLHPDDLLRGDLRSPDVDRAASQVAGRPAVRAALLDFQRQFGAGEGAVLDGRDIGTVIFPDAAVKLFLTASIPRRAERRWRQFAGDAQSETQDVQPDIRSDARADAQARAVQLARIGDELAARDDADAARAAAPLRPADDAVLIDTDRLDAREVLAEALRIVAEKTGRTAASS